MEKGTQKLLSILLSVALLFCFPVASQAAEDVYHQTFTGTYTTPQDVRNVLVSGNNASVSEWYGDRVNIAGNTYSVRQNEYGLNKDNNMIQMDLDRTYTVWLAQYGVASFQFTASEEGYYVFSASENSTYAPYLETLNNMQYNNIFYPHLDLVSSQYGRVRSAFYSYFYSPYREANTDDIVYKVKAGETIYLAASDSDKQADIVYDVKVEKATADNCPHDWEWTSDENVNACTSKKNYICRCCGQTKSDTYEDHDWTINYTHRAENCQDTATGVRTCDKCGKEENFSYENYGEHIPDENTKTLYRVGNYSLVYKYTCSLCGETFYKDEDSPCYNSDTDEPVHSFGTTDSLNCQQEATCTVCGYQATGYHSYRFSVSKTPIGDNGCYTYTYTDTCSKCGDIDIWSYSHHSSYEYVQITPQHDNVCGTYNYLCAACGQYEYEQPLTCHSNVRSSTACTVSETCRRCGNVNTEGYHNYDNGVYIAPSCTAQGGTLYTCIDCGATKLENAVSATGHNFGNNSATCLTCGTANPNYVAPTAPAPVTPVTQAPAVTTPVTTAPAATTQATTQATTAAKPKGAKKVDGVWVNPKYKKPTVAKITSPKKKQIKITWKKTSGVKGYEVQYSTSKKFTKKTTKKTAIKNNKAKKPSKTIKKLKSKKKYYLRVRSYKLVKVNGKNVKVYSKWSKVKSVKTK